MDTMRYLGFPYYPVHQIFPIDQVDVMIINSVQSCLLIEGNGVNGKNRQSGDKSMKIGSCPFRPFTKARESLFYMKKYLNADYVLATDPKYFYEIRSYELDMSIGVSLNEDNTWIPWPDTMEYAYLVDRELPNTSPSLKLDTTVKKSIAYEAFAYGEDLDGTVNQASLASIRFRNMLLKTQCLWYDGNGILNFQECEELFGWTHVAFPIYNPPGLPLNEDEYRHPRLDYVNTKELVIPPYISWFPFRNGINVYYTCYAGCLIIQNDTLQHNYDFDFGNMIS